MGKDETWTKRYALRGPATAAEEKGGGGSVKTLLGIGTHRVQFCGRKRYREKGVRKSVFSDQLVFIGFPYIREGRNKGIGKRTQKGRHWGVVRVQSKSTPASSQG